MTDADKLDNNEDEVTFGAVPHDGVEKDTCVIIKNDCIEYAGSIVNAPMITESLILLHQQDFDYLKRYSKSKTH